jgi:hypothetical protein
LPTISVIDSGIWSGGSGSTATEDGSGKGATAVVAGLESTYDR